MMESSSEIQLGLVVASNRVFFSTAPHPSPSIPTWAGATGIIIFHQQNLGLQLPDTEMDLLHL
jgi:hypothetical protein